MENIKFQIVDLVQVTKTAHQVTTVMKIIMYAVMVNVIPSLEIVITGIV